MAPARGLGYERMTTVVVAGLGGGERPSPRSPLEGVVGRETTGEDFGAELRGLDRVAVGVD